MLSVYYAKTHLGVNTDTSTLLSADLPFQKNRARWKEAFPQDADTLIFLIEAPTVEQTKQAAIRFEEKLLANDTLFEYVYIPGENDFFRQQGLLYLSEDKLKQYADALIAAQPFIGYLSQHYSLTGLLDILQEALDQESMRDQENLLPILEGIDQSIAAAIAGKARFLSWQRVFSPDDSTVDVHQVIVSARPIADFTKLKPIEQSIAYARTSISEILAQDKQVSIRITGKKALEVDEMRVLAEDTVKAGLLAMVLVIWVLFSGLRSVRLVVCTLITLIIGLIMTAGFATLAVGHLNVLSVAFAILYIGLGVDFAIHICLCYRNNKALTADNKQALTQCIRQLAFSLFLCSLTTSVGFLAFTPTDYKGVSELGLIAGGGMFIGLFVSLSLLPALLNLIAIKKFTSYPAIKMPVILCTLPNRHRRAIRVLAVLLAFAACFPLNAVYLDSNPVNLRDQQSESVVTFKRLLQSTTLSPFKLITLTDSIEKAEALAKQFDNMPTAHRVITLNRLIPDNQEDKLAVIDDVNLLMSTDLTTFERPIEHADSRRSLLKFKDSLIQEIKNRPDSPEVYRALVDNISQYVQLADQSESPEQQYRQLDNSILGQLSFTLNRVDQALSATGFSLEELPKTIKDHWLSADGVYKIVIDPKYDLNDNNNLTAFVADAQKIDLSLTGLPVSDIAAGKAVEKAFIQAFISALVVIFIILLFLLRNLRNTLLVICPLLLAGLLTAAVNVLLENPFNLANIIALPLLMGMGVDSGIHIMHRLHSGLAKNEHLLQTSTAKGVFFSSLTTLLSFMSLAFTNHQGIASMGLLLAIGITFTLISTLLVLPAFSKKAITL